MTLGKADGRGGSESEESVPTPSERSIPPAIGELNDLVFSNMCDIHKIESMHRIIIHFDEVYT